MGDSFDDHFRKIGELRLADGTAILRFIGDGGWRYDYKSDECACGYSHSLHGKCGTWSS